MECFDQVISLGFECRAKHQVSQHFWSTGSIRCQWGEWLHLRRGILDYQATPPQAVLAYLTNDFRGMFERNDLAIQDGRVVNVRYGTSHKHEFPSTITEATIDQFYAVARVTHDRRCAVTRKALTGEASTLFVVSKPAPEHFQNGVHDYIKRANPSKRFKLLGPPANDPIDPWYGDSNLWAEHLAGFKVRVPHWARVEYCLRRARKNARYLLPKALRPTSNDQPFGGFQFSQG